MGCFSHGHTFDKDTSVVISHKYRFIFIKTHKTAGTSIEVFLSQRCDAGDVFTPIIPPEELHVPRNYGDFYNHMPARHVRARVSQGIWGSYYKFCVERNPWDKVLSHYHMWNHRNGGTLTFDDYLAKGNFPLGYPLYTDETGTEVIVDRVLHFEALNRELAEVFAALGVPFEGKLSVFAKSVYRTDRRPYQQAYTDQQRGVIDRVFAWEIQRHGYRFE